MVSLILSACVVMFWAPADNATAYDIYKNGGYIGGTIGTVYTICRDNYGDVDDYFVVPFTRVGGSPVFGTPSDTLTVPWVWDWDLDDTWSGWVLDLNYEGIVGFADFGIFALDFGKNRPRSDSDWDGVVGFADFGSFASSFGRCSVRPEMYQWSKPAVPCP